MTVKDKREPEKRRLSHENEARYENTDEYTYIDGSIYFNVQENYYEDAITGRTYSY